MIKSAKKHLDAETLMLVSEYIAMVGELSKTCALQTGLAALQRDLTDIRSAAKAGERLLLVENTYQEAKTENSLEAWKKLLAALSSLELAGVQMLEQFQKVLLS